MDNPHPQTSLSYDYKAEKLRLLADIRSVIGVADLSNVDADAMAVLNEKITQFNVIKNFEDRNEREGSHICRDPLDALPHELWEEIILSSFMPDIDESVQWSLDQLIDLTNVSSRWNNAILGTASCWRTITIHRGMEDIESKIMLCSKLSGTLPLDISIDVPVIGWDTVGPLIGAQSDRIRTIFLNNAHRNFSINYPGHHDSEWGQDDLDNLMGVFPSLPALRGLVCYLKFNPFVDRALQMTDSLSGFFNILLSEHTLGLKSFQNLKTISTAISYAKVVYPLLSLPSLQEVIFYEEDPKGDLIDAHTSKYSVIPSRAWTFLCINQYPTLSLEPKYTSISQTLQSLEIRMTWSGVSNLILACSKMAKLDRLKIEFDGEDTTAYSQLLVSNLLPLLLYLSIVELLLRKEKGAQQWRIYRRAITVTFTSYSKP
jgi:hypothetical protein